MSTQRQELTFEGGVNVEVDPHLLKSNEWQSLKNLWPYRNKLLGTRPSLVFENEVIPVPIQDWDSRLRQGGKPGVPQVRNYSQWFHHLVPLKAVFMGSLDRMALVCVCTRSNKVAIYEQFEGEVPVTVILEQNDLVLILTPNDLRDGIGTLSGYPIIAGVRLGGFSNLTPSLVNFNGSIIAANKGCQYVVNVVPKSSLASPSPTNWSGIDYRFTKLNFGPTNSDFRADSVIVYKNRFVYSRANRIWFSDPFEPAKIFDSAVQTAYLGVFFDTGLTEEITAMTDLYASSLEEAGTSVLAIWTQNSMIMLQGEPATTVASTPEEAFAQTKITRIPITSGCISQASIVKTKFGLIWCGAESVWFMPRGNLPQEVGRKIGPRIQAQSFGSAGRIFATFDDECYRLVINAPNVGFNAYEALNEMWCLTFNGQQPSKESAAWFGPQVFTNTDNQNVMEPEFGTLDGGPPGIYCCAKLVNINDDRTWYINPFSYFLGAGAILQPTGEGATRLGLSRIAHYLGVDITSPFRPAQALNVDYNYSIGSTYQTANGFVGQFYSYATDFVVIAAGLPGGDMLSRPIHCDLAGNPSNAKRMIMASYEPARFPQPHTIEMQSGNMTLGNPELLKLIDGYELTFKTLNPIALQTWWWPWEPFGDPTNVVLFESTTKIFSPPQNVLGGFFNEPVLTARKVPAPIDKRYNGLTAQLNLTEPKWPVLVQRGPGVNPNWNKIKFSTNNTFWYEFDLFDFDENGIAKYRTVTELQNILSAKIFEASGLDVDLVSNGDLGLGILLKGSIPIYIDLTAQGWEWFGFVPVNNNNGFYGTNIISNVNDPTDYLYATGPVPFYTPHLLHVAKLAIRYRMLTSRPR